MTGKKWGIDEHLDYNKCVEMTSGPLLPKGRTLNWAGLRMFRVESKHGYPTISIRKGCASVAEVRPTSIVFMKGHWRTDDSFTLVNAMSPLPLGRQNGTWYFLLPHNEPSLLFTDGCRVSTLSGTFSDVAPRILWNPADSDPEVTVWPIFKTYIEGFCKAVVARDIGPCDAEMCWDCYFYCSKKIDDFPMPRGCEPAGLTHLLRHVGKSEFVPALLWRSIQEMGLNPNSRWDNVIGSRHPDHEAVHEYLSAYFRRRLGSLAAYHILHQSRLDGKRNRVTIRSDSAIVSVGKTADAPAG